LIYFIGILNDDDTAVPVGSVPYTEGLPSNNTQWVDILVNEMMTASDTDGAKARASKVLEVFERSIASRIGSQPLQSFQKVDCPPEAALSSFICLPLLLSVSDVAPVISMECCNVLIGWRFKNSCILILVTIWFVSFGTLFFLIV
jgi:hypothetical protein